MSFKFNFQNVLRFLFGSTCKIDTFFLSKTHKQQKNSLKTPKSKNSSRTRFSRTDFKVTYHN